MSGFFIVGCFFSMCKIDLISLTHFTLITVASFFTILAVYAYNSASGKETDRENFRLQNLQIISHNTFTFLGWLFIILAIIISSFLGINFIILLLLIFTIWTLYSNHRIGLKHRPYLGTILHFVAQIIHFNMCYLVFKPIDWYSISISVYFALAFSSGHINHELIDYEADKNAGIKTATVKYGPVKSLRLILFIVFTNILYLFFIYWRCTISIFEVLTLIIPLIVQFLIYVFFRKNILQNSLLIRSIYRVAFFSCILILILIKILQIYQ
jgi:4-hydroxybenzoate polyprenyltransferase